MNSCDFNVWGYLNFGIFSIPLLNSTKLWTRLQDACNEFRDNLDFLKEFVLVSAKRQIETIGHHIEHF